jgi:hypothetical protein
MEFGPAILRGVRLGAILFAVGLVGLTAYRVLDVEDDEDAGSTAKPTAVASAPAKAVKGPASQFYPPPPPPLPGRAAVAKPVRQQGRDVVVVDIPAARETLLVADASATIPDAPPDIAVQGPTLPAAEIAAIPAPPPPRSNRFIRSVRKLLHIGK